MTAWEFLRGAVTAWVLFLLLAPPIIVAATSVLSFDSNSSSMVAGQISPSFFVFATMLSMLTVFLPWSFGALLLLGLPSGYLLGRRLRAVSATSTHLIAYFALGALIGAATTLTAVSVMNIGSLGPWAAPAAIFCNTVVTALAAASGWWFTAQRALAADATQ